MVSLFCWTAIIQLIWMQDFEWILFGSDKVQFRKRQYHLRVLDLPCSFLAVRAVRARNMSQTCVLVWFCLFDVASDKMVFKWEHLWFPVPPQYIIQIVPFCPESVLFLPAECHNLLFSCLKIDKMVYYYFQYCFPLS